MNLNDYLQLLSSKSHEAGGGSASAMAAAMAAALLQKAYHFINSQHDITSSINIYEELENTNQYFNNLVLEDGKVFGKVLEAQRLEANTEDEKIMKQESMQKALKLALESPLGMLEKITEMYEYILILKQGSNIYADSEISVATNLLKAAYQGARANVLVNYEYIKDENYLLNIDKKVENLDKEFSEKLNEI